jgi:site-specific DNA-methyltransferase (adenine-specific)
MTPETIGQCIIYHGDSFIALDGAKADHVITDPPYESIVQNAIDLDMLAKRYGRKSSVLNFDNIDNDRARAAALFASISQGWVIAFAHPTGITPWRDDMEAAGMKYKQVMAWVKPDATPQFTGDRPSLGFEAMMLFWAGQGRSKWNGGGKRGVFTHHVNPSDRDGRHPTEKPLALMRELITLFTNEGDLVCDPYMGSGSTAVACIQTGRRFVGCEMNPKYYAIAVERITAAQNQGCLFRSAQKITQEKLEFLQESNKTANK